MPITSVNANHETNRHEPSVAGFVTRGGAPSDQRTNASDISSRGSNEVKILIVKKCDNITLVCHPVLKCLEVNTRLGTGEQR